MLLSGQQPGGQFPDRPGLVPGGLEGRMQFERLAFHKSALGHTETGTEPQANDAPWPNSWSRRGPGGSRPKPPPAQTNVAPGETVSTVPKNARKTRQPVHG